MMVGAATGPEGDRRPPAGPALTCVGKVLTKVCILRTPKSTESVKTQSAIAVTWSDLLTDGPERVKGAAEGLDREATSGYA